MTDHTQMSDDTDDTLFPHGGEAAVLADEDIVDRLRRRADKARERYPDHADDPATLVGGLVMDYEAAAAEIERLRAGLKDLARKALAAMRP